MSSEQLRIIEIRFAKICEENTRRVPELTPLFLEVLEIEKYIRAASSTGGGLKFSYTRSYMVESEIRRPCLPPRGFLKLIINCFGILISIFYAHSYCISGLPEYLHHVLSSVIRECACIGC